MAYVSTLTSLVARFEALRATPDARFSPTFSVFLTSDTAPAIEAPTFSTNHERLAWAAFVHDLHAFVRSCAAIGDPWGQPVFALTIGQRRGTLTCGAQWFDAPILDASVITTQDYHAIGYGQGFDERLAFLIPGPTGTDTWSMKAPMSRTLHVRAKDQDEAWNAGRALRWAGTFGIPAHDLDQMGRPLRHVTIDPFATPALMRTKGSVMKLARQAYISASKASEHWDPYTRGRHMDSEMVGIGVHTHSDHPTALLRPYEGLIVTPYDILNDDGFEHDHACQALHHLDMFADAVLNLPGLYNAPIALDLALIMHPMGLVGMGMTLHNGKANQEMRVDTIESATFLKAWAARLDPLLALPLANTLWSVPTGNNPLHGTYVSARNAQEAVNVARTLWGWTPTSPTTTVGEIAPLPPCQNPPNIPFTRTRKVVHA